MTKYRANKEAESILHKFLSGKRLNLKDKIKYYGCKSTYYSDKAEEIRKAFWKRYNSEEHIDDKENEQQRSIFNRYMKKSESAYEVYKNLRSQAGYKEEFKCPPLP